VKGQYPAVSFERALCINRREIRGYAWMAIGRLDGKAPFLLTYQGVGLTSWESPERLNEGLRKKILGIFRETCRTPTVRPVWVEFHDLTEAEARDPNAATERAADLTMGFHRDIWRREYLNDRDEDYLELKVPFAEKDAAKAVGARWEPLKRVWRIKRQEDLSAFARWLPGP
jgi:Domain of unknown function (DUF5710)